MRIKGTREYSHASYTMRQSALENSNKLCHMMDKENVQGNTPIPEIPEELLAQGNPQFQC